MGIHRSTGGFKPFAHLGTLMKDRLPPDSEKPVQELNLLSVPRNYPSDPDMDARLWERAMADVTPLKNRPRAGATPSPAFQHPAAKCPDAEVMGLLHDLINGGKGFVVSQTAEYMEGSAPGVSPQIPKRLHKGEFAIQDHVDLHGLTAAGAKNVLHRFLKRAVRTSKNGVLIVHGRGLCSTHAPVLKAKVCKWLTTGYWRRYVIAFSSARMCDGGPGATYVLLRDRPVSGAGRKTKIKHKYKLLFQNQP